MPSRSEFAVAADAVNVRLPPMICFRVTRYCNARCGFCLAPPDGIHPKADTLIRRIDWLMQRGVTTIHFCGGEPTIHPDLPELLAYVQSRAGTSRMTTNGIALSETLVTALRVARTRVKVSLHGDQEQHDKIVGRAAFDAAVHNLRRLQSANIPTTVQTTIVAGGEWVLDWVANFCVAAQVRQLSILPFIPRGSGYRTQVEYGLTRTQRTALRESVRRKRHALTGRVDVRWLDFSSQPLYVVEADGRVVIEGATESLDEVVCVIPGDPGKRKRIPIQHVSNG